jgi:chitodextrinase
MRGAQFKRMALTIGCALALLPGAALLAPASWATSSDTSPPSVPSGFRVISATETTLTVEWTPSADISGVTQYWTGAMSGNGGDVHPTEQPRYTYTGLNPDQQYGIVALAVDGAGNYSGYSQSFAAKTRPDTAAPSVPGNVGATPTLGHANVTWSASSDNHRVARYEVSVDGATVRPVSTSVTSAAIRNMAPASTHTFAVRAIDASGNRSSWSAPSRLAMPDGPDKTAPAAPSELRRSGDLLWNAATDNADNPEQLEYAVYADGVEFAFVGPQTRFATLDPYFCTETLLPGTHTYTVRATDRSGNLSPPSNAVVLTR